VGNKIENWFCVDLPVTDYRDALELQHTVVAAKIQHPMTWDVVLILEHQPVFTLGRRGGLENLTVDRRFLEKSGISVVQTERGGNITYHGPGQLVVYPIVDLKRAGLKVVDYVTALESVMMGIAGDFGITASRNTLNRGIWVEGDKLGSIGITVRRGISFHGFALNVNLSLTHFDWINPCGLSEVRATSMAALEASGIRMSNVRKSVQTHLAAVLGGGVIETGREELLQMSAFSSLRRPSNA